MSAREIIAYVAGSSAGIVAMERSNPRCFFSSLKQRSNCVSAPSPRRSTLKRPRFSISSLSHWITVRAFHGCVLDGDQVVYRLVPEQESAGVDGEMTGEILDLVGQGDEVPMISRLRVQAGHPRCSAVISP